MPQYANPYYDPVKAHEYYMQHRKLKGRKNLGSMENDGSTRSKQPAPAPTTNPSQKNYINDAARLANNPSAYAAESERGSTDGLNAEGKRVAAIAKKRIDADKKRDLAQHQEEMARHIQSMANQLSARVEKRQKEIASHAKTVQRSIDTLRDEIERASGDAKEKLQAKLYSRVKNLQAENQAKAIAIRNEANKDSTRVQAQVTSLKAQNDKKAVSIEEDYTERYYKELDKLKADPKYTSTSKGSSGGGSSSSGSGGSGGSGSTASTDTSSSVKLSSKKWWDSNKRH